MGVKNIHFGASARAQVRQGVDLLANAVAVTLGPRGRNVILDRQWDPPVVTKDGVTVAKEMEVSDHTVNIGVQLLIGIAARTSALAGDGTTTAILLARSILDEAEKLVAAGHDPMSIRRGVDKCVAQAMKELARLSRKVRGKKEITRVATISANGDAEIGDIVGRALGHVGLDGVVSVERGHRLESELELVQGMQIDRGLESREFATNLYRAEANLDRPRILLYDGKLEKLRQVLPILEFIKGEKKPRPLLILAEGFEGEAQSTLLLNKKKGGLPICIVSIPGTHERRQSILGDVHAVVGGTLFGTYRVTEPKNLSEKDFGTARRVQVEKATTTFLGGEGRKKDLDARIRYLKQQMAKANEMEAEALRSRLGALCGGVALIKVGGSTEIDQKEREARYDDSICAARAALEDGIVPGGGVALVRAAESIDDSALPEDERPAANIVRRALQAPSRQIATNAGADGPVVIQQILARKGAFGYDAATGRYGDLILAGVIDPTKVVRSALDHAASIAELILATETSIADAPIQPQEKTYLDPPKPDIRDYRPRAS